LRDCGTACAERGRAGASRQAFFPVSTTPECQPCIARLNRKRNLFVHAKVGAGFQSCAQPLSEQVHSQSLVLGAVALSVIAAIAFSDPHHQSRGNWIYFVTKYIQLNAIQIFDSFKQKKWLWEAIDQ
jgi:hypothetical protein